jgi:protein gp37
MGDKTAIEWCDATFNPWWGCAKVSPGCDHCYAEAWAKRTGTAPWGIDTPRREFGDEHWNEPGKWARTLPAKLGRRPRVFCASMADVFDKNSPRGARDRLWFLIANTPQLDWLLLTKRIGNVPRMLPPEWGNGWPNVWLGITVVNQEEADRDIPKLLSVPACVRFLSCEPLLGPVDLTGYHLADRCGGEYPFTMLPHEHRTTRADMLDWVISGGESGAKARPSHPDWHRSLRDQCAAAGVPFLFKQIGEWTWHDEPVKPLASERIIFADASTCSREDCDAQDQLAIQRRGARIVRRVGKKAAGRELDGRTHDDFPERTA